MNTLRRSTAMEWVLRNAAGEELLIRIHPGETLSIGRELSSDIPILDAGVSRHHASLEREGDEIWLEDLHSQNGTSVNTEPIRRTRLQAGDILTFGRISLALTARSAPVEEKDPGEDLSREQLARLLRISRDLVAGKDSGLVFQTLVRVAVEELRAERGAVLLRDPERPSLQPAAAHPADFMASALRTLAPNEAEAFFRCRKARTIGRRHEGAERGSSPGSPRSAMGVPLGRLERPAGILYLDRSSEDAFGPEDEDFLFALAWVASPAVETAARLAAMRAWNERLEGVIAEKTKELEERRARRGEPVTEGSASFLRVIEARLAREAARLAETSSEDARIALEESCILLAGIRRLQERRSARAEEVQVSHALSQAFEKAPGGTILSFEEGGELAVLCAPDELIDALRLARSWLATPRGARLQGEDASQEEARTWTFLASARAAPDGRTMDIRLSLPGAEVEPEAGDEILQVLRRLVGERLGGIVEGSPDGQALTLRLPHLAAELRETILLGELAGRPAQA